MQPRRPSRWQDVARLALLSALVMSGSLGVALAANPPATSPGAAESAAAPAAAAPAMLPLPGDAQDEPPAIPLVGGRDPIVASIEGHQIVLSELGRAERGLPENLRHLPFDSIYPVLLDRMIDHEALVIMARHRGLEDNPIVKKRMQEAAERVLEGFILGAEAAPRVTEAAVKARYDRLYANRPATEEVRAQHILVTTEAEAVKIVADLKKGADFATLAKQVSKDPDAAQGGELGFFRREQVWPGFADVAFALQPGQVADKPIHNEFGWHVIKVEERRLVAPPAFSEIHDQLRDEMMQEAVRQVVTEARSQVTIHKWNMDGSPMGEPRVGTPAAKPTTK